MGWDAYAVFKKKKFSKEFKAAAEAVKVEAGSVDWTVAIGGLDCSACALALEAATGVSAWSEQDWSKDYVKDLAARAVWPDLTDVPEEDRWAVASAKAFLETCAAVGVGIRFSW